MERILKNEFLTVTFSDHGGELRSVVRDGVEYLWQGNPTYWPGRAPILFPICGRLPGGKYTYRGKEYAMNLHGFFRAYDLQTVETSEDSIAFRLDSDATTLAQYPFAFSVLVRYTLDGATIRSEVTVENRSGETMPCTFGIHPGFNVPMDGNGDFSDWRVDFAEPCEPDALVFSDALLSTGRAEPFAIENGRTIPLRHDLFDRDAIFLTRVPGVFTLCSDKSPCYLTVEYPEIRYLGLWHSAKTEAPFVCLEPWCGMASYDGREENLETKNDMFHLPAGGKKTFRYALTFGRE